MKKWWDWMEIEVRLKKIVKQKGKWKINALEVKVVISYCADISKWLKFIDFPGCGLIFICSPIKQPLFCVCIYTLTN